MTPERANEIVIAINNRAFMSMGLAREAGALTGVTLAEMLEAKAIVKQGNAEREAEASRTGAGYSISSTPDDRLIAAVYTLEHFPPDNEPILCLPWTGFEGDRIAVAVVALDSRNAQAEEDDD